METMILCEMCKEVFEESKIVVVNSTYENYYGIPLNDYQSPKSLYMEMCPYCESGNLTKFSDEDYEEYLLEEEA